MTNPVSVGRAPPRPTMTFSTPADLIAFLNRETEFWQWTTKFPAHPHGPINNVVKRYRPERFSSLLQKVAQWESGDESARDSLQGAFNTRYNQEGNLIATDMESNALAELAETDLTMAGVALSTYHGLAPLDQGFFSQQETSRRGLAKGFAILAGIDPETPTKVKASLAADQQAFEQDASRLRNSIATTRQTAESSAEAIAANAKQLAETLEADFAKRESERQEKFEKLKAHLEEVTAAYERLMELQGPVRYWEKKARRHTHAKWISCAILIGYVAASVVLLNITFEHAAALLPTSPSDHLPLAALFKAGAFAILTTTIAFWIGRVLLRIYLSNQHLATDAEERMTMVMTFLAMVRKKVLADTDRQLILAPLFRPGSDGIVKEESAPDNAIATFLSGLTRKP